MFQLNSRSYEEVIAYGFLMLVLSLIFGLNLMLWGGKYLNHKRYILSATLAGLGFLGGLCGLFYSLWIFTQWH